MYSPSSVDPVTAQHFKYFLLFLLPLASQYPSVSSARTSAAFQKFGGSHFFCTYRKLFSAKCAIRTAQWNHIGHHIALYCIPISISHRKLENRWKPASHK